MQTTIDSCRAARPAFGAGPSSPARGPHPDDPATYAHVAVIKAPATMPSNDVVLAVGDGGLPPDSQSPLTLSSAELGSTVPALYRYELAERLRLARQRASQRGGNAR